MSSVLNKYKRQPKIYVTIPSQLRFVPESAYEGSFKDVPVFSMTGADELAMKNPESLLNGQANLQLIKSCVPTILDPGELSFIDLEFLLVAIRIATHGHEFSKSSVCPHCRAENLHGMDLSHIIDSYQTKEYDTMLTIDDLKLTIKPLNLKSWTDLQGKIFSAQRTMYQSEQQKDETEKTRIQKVAFDMLQELSEFTVCNQIVKISTPEGEETNPDNIRDFLLNGDRKFFNAVKLKLDKNMKEWEAKPSTVSCQECEKQYSLPVSLDDSSFFAG